MRRPRPTPSVVGFIYAVRVRGPDRTLAVNPQARDALEALSGEIGDVDRRGAPRGFAVDLPGRRDGLGTGHGCGLARIVDKAEMRVFNAELERPRHVVRPFPEHHPGALPGWPARIAERGHGIVDRAERSSLVVQCRAGQLGALDRLELLMRRHERDSCARRDRSSVQPRGGGGEEAAVKGLVAKRGELERVEDLFHLRCAAPALERLAILVCGGPHRAVESRAHMGRLRSEFCPGRGIERLAIEPRPGRD